MHPTLISLGAISIKSYGTMIVLGFLMGLVLIRLRIHKYPVIWDRIMDLAFYLLLFGALGAKLLFWIIFPKNFINEMQLLFTEPMEFFQTMGTGFVFFGSFIAGTLVLIWYCRRFKMPIGPTLDLLTPSVPLAHAFGRIGCFLAGCCYGRECHAPWAVIFTNEESLAPTGVPLHPTQLYESSFLFAACIIMLLLEKRLHRIPGRMLPVYAMLYGVWRVFVEFFRGDPRGEIFGGLMTTTQGIALGIILIGVFTTVYMTLRAKKRASVPQTD